MDSREVGLLHEGFEDFGLDDEEVSELTEHGETFVERWEGEEGDGFLVEGEIPEE